MLRNVRFFTQTRPGPERHISLGLGLFFGIGLALFGSACDSIANDPVTAPSPTTIEERFGIKKGDLAANLDEKTIRTLRADFKRKLAQEKEGLKREEKQIRKTTSGERRTRRREWNKKEQAARHQFFKENPKGPDRRTYVKEFIERRTEFYRQLKDEEGQERNRLDTRRKNSVEDQRKRLLEFEAALLRRERPTETLWNPSPAPDPAPGESASPSPSPR